MAITARGALSDLSHMLNTLSQRTNIFRYLLFELQSKQRQNKFKRVVLSREQILINELVCLIRFGSNYI